jgi:hypothetical protein
VSAWLLDELELQAPEFGEALGFGWLHPILIRAAA